MRNIMKSIIALLLILSICYAQSPTVDPSPSSPSRTPTPSTSTSPSVSPSPSCSPSNCSDDNLCTIDSCENGTCIHTPVACYSDECTSGYCDNTFGCINTTLSCNKCLFPSVVECPYKPCKIVSCDSDFGTCTYKDLDCGNGSCDEETGQCKESKSAVIALSAICASALAFGVILLALHFRKNKSSPPSEIREEIFYEEEPCEKSNWKGHAVGVCVTDRQIVLNHKDQTISMPLMLVSQEGRYIWTGKPGENARIAVEILRLFGESDTEIRKKMEEWWGRQSPMEISNGKVILEDDNTLSFETMFEIILEYCLQKLTDKSGTLPPVAIVGIPSWFYLDLQKREKLKNLFQNHFKSVTILPQGKIALHSQPESQACISFHGGSTELSIRTPYGYRYSTRKVGPVDITYALWKKAKWNILDQAMKVTTGGSSRYPPNKFVAEISGLLSCVTQFNGKSVHVDTLNKDLRATEMNAHLVEFKNMESFIKYESGAMSAGLWPPHCCGMKFKMHLDENALAAASAEYIRDSVNNSNTS